jgi:hypothetical protein
MSHTNAMVGVSDTMQQHLSKKELKQHRGDDVALFYAIGDLEFFQVASV